MSTHLAELARAARSVVRDRASAAALLRLGLWHIERWASPACRAKWAEAIGRIVSLSDDAPVDADTIVAAEDAKRLAASELRLDARAYGDQLASLGAMLTLHALTMSALLEWSGPSTRAIFTRTADPTPIGWQGGRADEKGGSDHA
jgi:hypothetical protein